MYETLHVVGVEGLVRKLTCSTYDCGVRGWIKVKRRTSSDAVVGGYVGSPQRLSWLLLGRYAASGRLRVVGRTTQPAKQGRSRARAGAHAGRRRAPLAADTAARLGVQPVRPA
ncbi:hypothetical protein ACNF49_35200 [Actinomadura sp. ATCC 39365]